VGEKKVGFKKPPLKDRFKKGQSGNPKGRPPKVKNTSILLKIELDKIIVVRENGKEIKLTKREALITSLVNDAITGKNQARPLLLKILDVSPPVDPFVATDEDDAAFDAFLNQQSKKAEPGDGNGGDGQDGQD
jgi:hypothetical protein